VNWDRDSRGWPNRGWSRFAEVRPHRWHIQEAGAGSGPRLLFLHGAGASTHSWRDVLPRLVPGHHVMALDLPGQGFTRLGNRMRCGLGAMAEDIAALLAAEGFRPDAIVGHSAGAAIALRLAIDLESPPGRIVAINGALQNFPGVAGVLFPALARLLALNPLTAVAVARTTTTASVRRLIASTGSQIDAAGLGLYHRLITDRAHVDATLAMMAQWQLSGLLAELPRVAMPVLFLAGGRDKPVPPETSDRAAGRVAAGRCRLYPELGHLMHEEDPTAIAVEIAAFAGARASAS
jgi:magnesium chelatase accessory protein